MTISPPNNLLRRTAAAIVALATLLFAGSAAALTMTLPGGMACTSPSITTQPDGSLSLACGSTVVPPPPPTTGPGTFTVSAPATTPAPVAGGTPLINVISFTVLRSGGTTGDVSMTYTISGNACWTGAAQTTVFDGQSSGVPIGLTMIAAGTCTVTISGLSAGTLGTPASVSINVTAPTPPVSGGGGGVPTVPGCPTAAPGTQMGVLPIPNGPSILSLTAASDQITSFPMYSLSTYNRTSAQPSFGQTPAANSPAPATINVSISPCPGVMDPTLNDACNMRGITITNGVTFGWATVQSVAQRNLECYAPEGTQMYYNVSWHYNPGACSNGAPTCGWSVNVN